MLAPEERGGGGGAKDRGAEREDLRASLLPGGDGAGAAAAAAAAAPEERPLARLGAAAVTAVLFASVAGGPYGIEAAVGAAGALPTLVGCVVLALLWSAPQALVAAELATAFPSDGGSIAWVLAGLGPTAGFVNAANVLAQGATNLPLYPVLFASYVAGLAPALPPLALLGVKAACLAIAVGCNAAGVLAVSQAATALSLLVQAPFVALPIVAAVRGAPAFDWSAVLSVIPGWTANASLFVATLCWNSAGWLTVGNIASEVKRPQAAFPAGAAVAVLLVALNYIVPVAIGVALAPDATAWTTGYFSTLGANVAPWLGVWVTVGAAMSCLNNFLPQLSTAARALRFTALYGMLPLPLLSRSVRVGGVGGGGGSGARTPLPAILVEAVIVGLLMNFGFDVLVVLSVLFYNVSAALQFAAFLRLRYTQPALPRAFAVPGGLAGAWLTVLVFYAVLAISLYASFAGTRWTLPAVAGAQLLFIVVGALWARRGGAAQRLTCVDLVEAAGIDAGDAAAAAGPLARAAEAVAAAAAAGRGSDVRAWMRESGFSLLAAPKAAAISGSVNA